MSKGHSRAQKKRKRAHGGDLSDVERWLIAGLASVRPEQGITMGPNGRLVCDPQHPNFPFKMRGK